MSSKRFPNITERCATISVIPPHTHRLESPSCSSIGSLFPSYRRPTTADLTPDPRRQSHRYHCFVLLLTYFSSIGVVAVVSKICGSCDGSYQSYQSMNNISIRFVISEPQTTTTQRIICQEASSTQAGLLFHTAVILFTRRH